jgi:pimeloyl-ACP methyl ester carboxylesterase
MTGRAAGHSTPMADYRHSYVDVGDVVLHVASAGPDTGPPVLLVHGFPQTWYSWTQVAPLLVDAGFRCLIPDLRGLGDSTRPLHGYDKQTLGEDLVRLLDALGIDRTAVVGHDWGGVVAFSIAARHPERVSRLGVVDVAIPGDGAPNISQGGRRWHHAFLGTLDLPEALITGREEVFLRWFYEHYGHHQRVLPDDAVAEYLRCYTAAGALRAGFELYRTVPVDIAANETLEKIDVPVLAVGGATSFGRGAEVEESLRRMAHDVTGHVLADCGHWVPEEKPCELAELIVRHLS